MEHSPKFIREYDKEKDQGAERSPDELSPRQELAKNIREKRSEYFDRQKEIESRLQEIKELSIRLNEISETIPKKIKNYFEYRRLQAEIAQKTEEHKHIVMTEAELPVELLEAEEMLNDYYQKAKSDWLKDDPELEEAERLFSQEHLESISTEDYVLLLQKYPSSLLMHVTRHGIRDHGGMFEHQAGMGKFHHNFQALLSDGRLRSPLGVYVSEEMKKEEVYNFLNKSDRLKEWIKEEGLEKVLKGISHTINKYEDISAIHLALNEVLDGYYGGESGNEIFIAYPSLSIFNRHPSRGPLHDGFVEGQRRTGGQWNDTWVWTRENEGLPINAGLVFIPRNTLVSARTGSKYEVDESNNPIIIQESIDSIKSSFSGEFPLSLIESWDALSFEQSSLGRDEIRDKLVNLYGLDMETASVAANLHIFVMQSDSPAQLRFRLENIEENIFWSLFNNGSLFKRATDPITSEEYWNNYFSENPDQKPKHLVFYEGSDPTKALLEWLRDNNINVDWRDDLVFPEINEEKVEMDYKDGRYQVPGRERFEFLARKIVAEIAAQIDSEDKMTVS